MTVRWIFFTCCQREQLRDHEERVSKLEAELEEHRRHPPERGAKALTVQNYKEKDAYLHHEVIYNTRQQLSSFINYSFDIYNL